LIGRRLGRGHFRFLGADHSVNGIAPCQEASRDDQAQPQNSLPDLHGAHINSFP